MNERIEMAIEGLNRILPGIANESRAGDYELLMGMGFAPAPPRTASGAFFEWRREVYKDDDVISVSILLYPSAAAAFVSSRLFRFSGSADGPTVEEALKKALEMAMNGK